MQFDVYVYNNPHNAWTYTRGYINAFQKLGMLGQAGDIVSWHNPDLAALFSTGSQFIVLIGPEHHRGEIFGTAAKRDAIMAWKRGKGKKLIGICYESSVDPFGKAAWVQAGYPWLADNCHKYGSMSSQCYNVVGLDEQFRCLDYVFTQDEVDVAWMLARGINAHWLPACVDTDVFRPMDGAPLNKAGFIGNAWWPREELIRFYPFPFDIVTVPKTEFSAPAIADVTLGLVQAYNRFNVAINMRSPFAGVSMRTFELMACGKYVITYRPAPDRAANIKLFDGWPHLAWFCEWSPSDQAKLLNYHTHLIANYAQTRQRGLENRQLILMGHTPAHRVSEIVSKL